MKSQDPISLPVKPATTASAKSVGTRPLPEIGRGLPLKRRIRLLVVDNSAGVRKELLKLIDRNGAIELVGCAEDGIQGGHMFFTLEPDVVLVDLSIPGISGAELIPVFRRARPECVLIVLTTFPDDVQRARCLNLGVDHFFNKTTELKHLIELLDPKKAALAALPHPAHARAVLAAPA